MRRHLIRIGVTLAAITAAVLLIGRLGPPLIPEVRVPRHLHGTTVFVLERGTTCVGLARLQVSPIEDGYELTLRTLHHDVAGRPQRVTETLTVASDLSLRTARRRRSRGSRSSLVRLTRRDGRWRYTHNGTLDWQAQAVRLYHGQAALLVLAAALPTEDSGHYTATGIDLRAEGRGTAPIAIDVSPGRVRIAVEGQRIVLTIERGPDGHLLGWTRDGEDLRARALPAAQAEALYAGSSIAARGLVELALSVLAGRASPEQLDGGIDWTAVARQHAARHPQLDGLDAAAAKARLISLLAPGATTAPGVTRPSALPDMPLALEGQTQASVSLPAPDGRRFELRKTGGRWRLVGMPLPQRGE